jgi:hypothetical protein
MLAEYFTIEKIESTSPEYLAMQEAYEKDLAYYQEHSTMLNKPPMPPSYMGTVFVIPNERGLALHKWYTEFGKDLNVF